MVISSSSPAQTGRRRAHGLSAVKTQAHDAESGFRARLRPGEWMWSGLVDQLRYDGFKLWGRLLIHAETDVTIDRRLGFEVVRIHDVVDCDSERPAPNRLIVDYAWRERAASDLVSLRPGEWFRVD